MNETEFIEKEIFVLTAGISSKNHRTYTYTLVSKWMSDARLSDGGIPIENCMDDLDYEYNYIDKTIVCGYVTKLRIDEFCNLLATVRIKTSSGIQVDTIAITPKGEGHIKNKIVQDDYNLYGFSAILSDETSFDKNIHQPLKFNPWIGTKKHFYEQMGLMCRLESENGVCQLWWVIDTNKHTKVGDIIIDIIIRAQLCDDREQTSVFNDVDNAVGYIYLKMQQKLLGEQIKASK